MDDFMERVATALERIADGIERRAPAAEPDIAPATAKAWSVPRAKAEVRDMSSPACPRDGSVLRLVEAGVSAKSGKPYAAFYSCDEAGCGYTAKAA